MTASTPKRGRTTSTEAGTDTGGWTRFAPAPTGYLHLGHVANALWVWGMAGSTRARVLLRIEDHDRERSRAAYDAAILDDLDWLGFEPDAGPVRQREHQEPYAAALDLLRMHRLVYACDCTRATYAAWARQHGRRWRGPGCPSGCRSRGLPEDDDLTLRMVLGSSPEPWDDRILGHQTGDPSLTGDPPVRDRHGNWTYGFTVVVDDLRQSIKLVVRGEDLADATPAQIRLARLLGRRVPPMFAHHSLIRKSGGTKLSKADGDTGVRELRAAGQRAAVVIGAAAVAVGLIPNARPVEAVEATALVRASLTAP